LHVEEVAGEQLTAPLAFFVEVTSYTAMTGKPPAEQDLCYKKFQGVTLTGVP